MVLTSLPVNHHPARVHHHVSTAEAPLLDAT
jgi:hypothetical protein